MYLRISTLLCIGVLVGFTTATQPSTTPSTRRAYWSDSGDDIDIDNELEGSGGGKEVKGELEASGSGLGPDDEDSEDDRERTVIDPRLTTTSEPSPRKIPEVDLTSDKNLHENKGGIDNGEVFIMNPKSEDRPTSFFAQPGILAAVIGGAVVGLLCAILVVMFIVYRMRKKDEGSYALDEPKRSPTGNTYAKGNNREFYA